jgi:hypothetical protein
MTLVVNIRNATPKGNTPLCETCSWAHIQYGFAESEQSVQCNYGWDFLREVPFPVRACTNYNNRTLPDMAAMEKLAWKLEFRRSAHPLGFSTKPVLVKPEEEED